MRRLEVSAVYNYIYNNRQLLEQEVRQRQANLRYHEIDVVDCIELACAIERLNTFKQTSHDIMSLLKLVELEEL